MDFDSLVDDSQKTQTQPAPQQPVMFDDLKDDNQSEPVQKFDDLKDDSEKYSTPEQQIKTAAEGITRGGSLGLSTAIETAPVPEEGSKVRDFLSRTNIGRAALLAKEAMGQVDPNAIAARQQVNPNISMGSEFAGNLASMGSLPKIGSSAIDGMIKMGLMGAGDEFSKAMLGQGDPALAVTGHILGSAAGGLALGKFGGALADKVASKAEKLAEEKFGADVTSYLSGGGHSAKGELPASSTQEAMEQMKKAGIDPELFNVKRFIEGQKDLMPKVSSFIKQAVGAKGATLGANIGFGPFGIQGAIAGEEIGRRLGLIYGDKFSKYISPKVGKMVVGPVLTKMAANGNFQGVAKAVDHGLTSAKGYQALQNGVKSIFQSGAGQIFNLSNDELKRQREETKKYIDEGGVDNEISQQQPPQEGFAEGGIVSLNKNNPIAEHWPEQNMLLSASKARTSNYLKANKPMSANKLQYDSDRKDPHQEKEYDRIIDIANNPLSILSKIKKGTLVPKDVKHFSSMYPEVHDQMSKEITKQMLNGEIKKEKKPPYHIRQALSLFLGTDLDSSLTPASIMAAQNVFMQQNAQKQSPPNSKSNLSKIGPATQTAEQARASRLNKN